MFTAFIKLKNLLYIFQQEEYEVQNFLNWIAKHREWENLEKKKKLVWTLKAKLMYGLSLFFLVFGLGIGIVVFPVTEDQLVRLAAIAWMGVIVLSFWVTPYFLLIASSKILAPLDYLMKNRIIARARQKLQQYPDLKIVGITGSYGKTSVKEFLNTLLKEKYRVLMTPDNINTPLGISDLIKREDLSKYDILIVEMGAYRQGDIKQICDLVQPDYAVLTGINESHLDKFGSLEETIKTKFELIESLPKKGKAFVNGDDQNVADNCEKFGVCEQKKYSKSRVSKLRGSKKGMEFSFKLQGKEIDFRVQVLGEHNVTNLVGVMQIAQELGLDRSQILTGTKKIKAVKHRLQPIFNPNGVIVIDDSYNGNPTGVNAAIEVLKLFKEQRKILITPGLVELGEAKEEVHIKIGEQLAEVCDLVILIENSNLPYLIKGLKNKNWRIARDYTETKGRLLVYATSEQAHAALPEILKKGDVILFQNDWTDNYS